MDRIHHRRDGEEEDDDFLDELVVSAASSICCEYDTDEEEEKEDQPTMQNNHRRRNKRRRIPSTQVLWTDENGCQHPFTPKSSLWYSIYIAHPNLDDDCFHQKFRIRFRLPYLQFTELVASLEIEGTFVRWHVGSVSCIKKEATPISLLVLCSLRYLGRGWTFDDLSENTAISIEVIRSFFHLFISHGSTVLYNRYVRSPSTDAEARFHMEEYALAGFPGAVGSTDATHIMLERVNFRFRQSHMGFKMTHTARTYNITVNHRRRILATTQGHPARWNDKTLSMFDDFMQQLQNGDILDDVVFELYDRVDNGTIIK